MLANVAGIGSSPSLCDCTDDELERVLAVNLLGAARLMHAVLPVMKAQRRGAIVNVGSVAGEAGVMGIYSASKFGLRGLSDSVRREVRSTVASFTDTYQYTIDQLIEKIVERCRALNLRLTDSEEATKIDFMIFLTVQTMNYLHSGRHRVAL